MITPAYRKLTELSELEHNPRTISKKQFDTLKKSLTDNKDYFEARPIILSNRTGKLVIIAGNQRFKAAKALGMVEVPTVLLEGLSEEREREIIIRDNVSNGDWDMDILANEWDVEQLQEWGVEEIKPFKEIKEIDPDPVDDENTYSIVGDIYQLGEHRVFCGSFEDDEGMRELFGDKKAVCTFTDPPYNVEYVGKTKDALTIKNDKMANKDFEDFLNKAFECVAKNTVQGGGVISWMSPTTLIALHQAMESNGISVAQLLCWVKDRFVLGHCDFQVQQEPAAYGFNEGSFDKTEEDGDGTFGLYSRSRSRGKWCGSRKLSTCWFFERPKASRDHPTMKPIGLCAKGILALSEPDDIVFDPFLGSGSTLIAAEQTGRKCYGSEIDPKYCDVIRKRWCKAVFGSEDGWQEKTQKEVV